MKINIFTYSTVLLLTMFTLSSCKKQNIVDDQPEKGNTQILKPFVDNGKLNLPIDFNGNYIMEGDIILSNDQAQFLIEKGRKKSDIETQSTFRTDFVSLWPGGVVYYSIDGDFVDRNRITEAITIIQNSNSGVTFIERTNQSDYIQFTNTYDSNIGGSSQLGRVGGKQVILLYISASKGSAIHEILHSLGIFHEQSRADRDNYITIHPENIANDYRSQFNTYVERGINGIEIGDFDFDSVMLYPSDAFTNRAGVNSMTTKAGASFGAQRTHLSINDAEGIKYMYKPIYVKSVFVLDEEASHNNVGATDEDVYQVGDVYLQFYADANFTIPKVLQYPLKVKAVSYYSVFQQGSSSQTSETLVPSGSSSFYLGYNIYEYRSEYGNIVSSHEEGVYATAGVGYISDRL